VAGSTASVSTPLARLQGEHARARFDASFVPPSALGTTCSRWNV
jgi:hypothetical protein